nr:MAG TPA: AAA domain protein [Caudoviricetes sp.]
MMKLSCEGDAIKLLRRQRQEQGDYPSPGRGRQCRTKHQAGFEPKNSRGSGKSEVLVIIYILRFSDTSDGAESQGLPGRPGRYFLYHGTY